MLGRDTVQTTEAHLELDGASSADVRIALPAGELAVRGGARGMLDATFICDERLEREIRYDVRDGHADLLVRQLETPSLKRVRRNDWDIALNAGIPLGLRIDHDAGDTTLDARELRLTRLALRQQAGRVSARLDADQPQLTEVEVDTQAGATEVSLRGAFDALRALRVTSKAGMVELDLRGAFRHDLDVQVESQAGSVLVRLPEDVGVEVAARTTVGVVDARGLTHDGGVYRNALCGTAPVTLRLAVSTRVGKIRLEAGAHA